MMEKLSLLSFRQKITLLLIALFLLALPLTLLALKQRTEYRGRAQIGEDPRTLTPSTFYIPYFPVGKAEKVEENELDTAWRNTLEVSNLAGEENTIEATFFNQSGEVKATISSSLLPHASASLTLPGEQECWAEGCLYSVTVNSSRAVSIVTNLVREAANQYSVTSYKGMHVQELPSVAHFPAIIREQGYNQEDKIETEFVFFNPNDAEVELNGDIYDSQGPWNIPTASFSETLKPKSSYRVNTKDLNLPFPFKGSAVVNQSRQLASVVLLQSDKRLYSYTAPVSSEKIFIPAVNNTIFLYPTEFKNTVAVQSHAPGRQEVVLKFVKNYTISLIETTFEVDPNLTYFFDVSDFINRAGFSEPEEGAVILSAQYPISGLMIKETPTYWGDIVLGKIINDYDGLYFPFIAYYGSDIETRTYFSVFNPQDTDSLSLTFTSYDQQGNKIRGEDDDPPLNLPSLDSRSWSTDHNLETPEFQRHSQGSLIIYNGVEGKGFLAVVEGVRRLSDSRALLAGDAFFSYEGQPLYVSEIPTPIITSEPTPEPTYTPPPDLVCPPECNTGLPRRMGNAKCDEQIDEIDFAAWFTQYKLYQQGEIIAPEDRLADFYCDEDNPSTQVVDLLDFEFWRRNAFGGPIPTPKPSCPNPAYCFDPDFCPVENQHPEYSCSEENRVCCLYLEPTPSLTPTPTLKPDEPTPTLTPTTIPTSTPTPTGLPQGSLSIYLENEEPGTIHQIGDFITLCHTVSEPGNVVIYHIYPLENKQTVWIEGWSAGGCTTFPIGTTFFEGTHIFKIVIDEDRAETYFCVEYCDE